MPLSRITSPFQSATANVYSPSANTVAIRTSSADRLKIDSGGRITVNTPTASNNDVAVIAGPIELGGPGNLIYGTGGVQTGMVTNLYYNGGWKIAKTGSACGMYYQLDGRHTWNATDYGVSAGSADSSPSLTTLLSVSKANTVALQGATNQAGIGITFPATQSASSDPNTLDDYEEGTWTPSYTSVGATWSYTPQYGTYVKIGQMVYAQFYLFATASGTTSNQVVVTGLPFTSFNQTPDSAYHQAGCAVWFTNSFVMQPLVNNNAASITLWKHGSLSVSVASEVSGRYLVGSAVYRAAS
jgi:hypothetical protein